MEPRSSLYQLIERQLGTDLAEYVAERRAPLERRSPRSWRSIADELSEHIGIEVNHETLRLWFGESEEPAQAGAA